VVGGGDVKMGRCEDGKMGERGLKEIERGLKEIEGGLKRLKGD
jgi:hypothetical protein